MPPLPETASSVADDFGGPYTNQRAVDDPTCEMDDGYGNQLLNDVSMMSHTSERAWVSFNGHTYVGPTDVITVTDHDAHWGTGTPTKPTIAQTAANRYVITWPTTVLDNNGATKTLNIKRPYEPMTMDSALSRAKVVSKTANTLTIDTFNSAGTANGLNGIPIFVSWS